MKSFQVELYANYALRDLLPKEIIQRLEKAKCEPGRGNTIILAFNSQQERDSFLHLIKNQFSYRYM